jgi:phthiocerol/phenolphthiocerol synthesis type-I polyketide synthase A
VSPLDEDGLRTWLVDYLVDAIGLSPDEIDCDAPLKDLAVGSADAVVMIGELSELLGRELSPVDLWQYPTVNALATYLTGGEIDPVALPDGADSPGAIRGRESIAVVGVGCRFPGGVNSPDALWDLMVEGRSGVREVPEGRWDRFGSGSPAESAALADTTRWGGFLDDVAGFDAEFFEIPAGEADKMDPQQRLLLEVTQEALDNAGIPAQSLRHTQTGVFAGACLGEYASMSAADLSAVDAWSGTGGAMSIIANRLSYVFDLRGPSVTVDTACSSSLVAVHLACQSLRSGESDLALAAGVNVLLSPAPTRSFDAVQAMSPTGACHSFDASADGFVRSEGAGVLVLKRLSDALAAGDRVLAVVRGSAVNQDGRSNGLMAPNPAAQMAVLRAAYADAGVDPRDVDYVEAHGTGTLLGDPIEARALGTVLGRGRPAEEPLLIGSVKTNLGHLEAAAGVAGLAKAALALSRGSIPATAGYHTPNPHIPFESLRLKVVAAQTDWPDHGRPRLAGVSSFGFGGTNAHVVLEQAPAQTGTMPTDAAPEALPESGVITTLVVPGKTTERIAALATELADWMQADGAGVALAEVAHTLNHHRSRSTKFATVCARDRAAALAGLTALGNGQPSPGVVGPHQGSCRSGVVFVFSGQGSQWAGMGRQLLADEPAFAAAVDVLEPVFVDQVGFSLRAILETGEAVVGIDRIQPVLVGVQLALTELWRSCGVTPDAVIGHSMGEVTAAVVAGALSPADGLKVIATRSKLMSRLSGQGAMALLELRGEEAEDLLSGYPGVSVAVEASPRQVVIAGPPEQVDAVIAEVSAQDKLARRVDVDVASHHAIIDPVLPDLRAALADLTPRPPVIPVFVTTGAAPTDGTAVFDAEHWVNNLRQPVMFSRAIAAAGAQHGTFIEVSPHPILTYAIDDTLTDTHHHTLPTLVRDADDTLTFHTHLNATHTTNPPATPHASEPHAPLPATPWQHTRHWISMPAPRQAGVAAPAPGTVLGAHLPLAGAMTGHLWQAVLGPQTKPYPGFRRIAGVEVVPASVLIATLTAAAADCGAAGIEDIRFDSPLTLEQPRLVQVFTDGAMITISSAVDTAAADQHWVRNVTARVSAQRDCGPTDPVVSEIPAADPATIEELHSQWGVEGRAFDWSIDFHEEAAGRLRVDVAAPSGALLDAAMDIAQLVVGADAGLTLPISVERIDGFAGSGGSPAGRERRGVVDVRRRGGDDGDLIVDVSVKTGDGHPTLRLHGVRFRVVESRAALAPAADPADIAHAIDWRPWEPESAGPAGGSVAVIGNGPAAQTLRDRFAALGHPAGDLAGARYVVYVPNIDNIDNIDKVDNVDKVDTADSDVDLAVRLICEVGGIVDQLVARDPRNPASLWVLTHGVQEAATDASRRQSCLWALSGVIDAEQPQLWGGLVDLEPGLDPGEAAPQLSKILGTPSKSTLLLRNGELLAATLGPLGDEPARPPLRCRPDAAYLITGGLGDLGLLTAGWLADLGARHLVLLGRTAVRRDADGGAGTAHSDPGTRRRLAAIAALERRGISVETAAIDVGAADEVQALLARREAAGAARIRGVVHSAGLTEGQLVTDLDPERVRRTVWPKIAGARVLDAVFPPGSLDFLYLTASAGAVFGVPGQAAYAAGNAYLDGLARARRRQGDNTVSLDWVAWEGIGFGKDAQLVVDELERVGSRPINPVEASSAWEYVSRFDVAQVVMAPMHTADSAERTGGISVPTRDWTALSPEDLHAELQNGVRAILAGELRVPEDQIEVDRPFAEMGLNSVMAISIRRQLEQLVGLELSATMLFNHPTIESFSSYLATRLSVSGTADAAVEYIEDESAGSLLDSLFDTVESTPFDTVESTKP